MNFDNAMDVYKLRYQYNKNSTKKEFCREITFQVTEACNLQCTYCYQIHKTPKVMSWEVAKAGVDLLFNMWIKNDENAFINRNTEFIILDFIGGEPLLQVGLMDKICTYFIDQALEINPLWAETFMISFATNGTLYFEPKVQDFIKKWNHRLSLSVSIDGPKEMHDACRVFPDGRGSFDLAKAAQDHYNLTHYASLGTKATISWENMPFLDTTIQYYIDQGYKHINANTIYEEDWTPEQAQFYYIQLKKIADILLAHNGEVEISLFQDNFFRPRTDMKQTWCGGYDSMLAFDPDGNAFPCIRYMESSLGGQMPPVIIGDVWNGLWKTPEQKRCHDCLACVTWTTQNDEECLNCPIAQGCADCAAESYQHMGGFNKRHKLGSCWVHRARSLANVYYWNKLWRQQGRDEHFKRYLPDDIALQIVDKEELEFLDKLERGDTL